ncbi:MAG: hypothetical protein JW736_01320 [Deltaproteobacteria bacterium]|nr:hypothetical protein [Deltaproteobacteria bacterium]
MAETVFKGIVIPAAWRKDGAVVAVAISTDGEDELRVENEGRGKDLLRHIRAEVEVRGTVSMENDEKRINVTEFKICRAWK